jgi:hypothetical protein
MPEVPILIYQREDIEVKGNDHGADEENDEPPHHKKVGYSRIKIVPDDRYVAERGFEGHDDPSTNVHSPFIPPPTAILLISLDKTPNEEAHGEKCKSIKDYFCTGRES